MRLRPLCVVLMLLLMPTTARAHGHVWDMAFGAASAASNRLWGGRVSIGLTHKIKDEENLSWLIDITNLKDRDSSRDITQLAYLVGPRYAIGNDNHVLMLHGLGGILDRHEGATGSTNFVMTAGAAYEWVPGGMPAGWAARVQAEHSFIPKNGVKGSTQISVSAVKRFD